MKNQIATFILFMIVVQPLNATQIAPKSLQELVTGSDVVVQVNVIDVYGKNKFDALVRNPDFTTGPGLDNRIILMACVKEILYKSSDIEIPKCFEVSLWKRWHLSLNSIVDYQSQEVILLLKGKRLKYVYPRYFIWPLEKKKEIEELIKKRDTD